MKKFQKWRHPAFKSPEVVRGKLSEKSELFKISEIWTKD